jgi:hypothetical protein
MKMKELLTQCELRIHRTFLWCRDKVSSSVNDQTGDVPGWVLVVLMTTGLVTGIWTLAAPKLSSLLNDSLNSMNNIR